MAQTSDLEKGLSSEGAKERLKEFGPNQIVKPQQLNFFSIFKEEITEPMILLLIFVGIMYSVWGSMGDAITIFSIIVTLALVEVWNEYRAKKAIASLSVLAAPKVKVIRSGEVVEVETRNVVPEDVMVLNPGTRIAADGIVGIAFNLQVDESSLTGESLPVTKNADDEIFAGTMVLSGEGKAEVLTTGIHTKLGRLASAAATIKQPKTPLQLAMKKLALGLAGVALFFSIIIPVLGVMRGGNLQDMILVGLALAFATIPEEGPIIITMVLGLGAYQLSKKNFLIKKIKAAEVLGSATVILTDKTGTLTENEMHVAAVFPEANESEIIRAAVRVLTQMSLFATDKALIEKAQALSIYSNQDAIFRERTLGGGRNTKAVIRLVDGEMHIIASGAPEEIFSMAIGDLTPFQRRLDGATRSGRRAIAVASKVISTEDINKDFTELEKDLSMIGLISLDDPAREGVKETLASAQKAGIRTIMVTGDHPQTAETIARSVGIPTDVIVTGTELDAMTEEEIRNIVKKVSIFARATPENKYRLLQTLQKNGEIVAVTGDGVNDVLALKGANIGIAMGIRGTDAAKEAADVVLADDDYNTIAYAIFEGRKFYDNLKKGFGYYLSAKTALILAFLLPIVMSIPFPFAPIQIIILELFMDLAASSGFVAEPAEKNIYAAAPRKAQAKFIDAQMLRRIIVSGISLFAAVMGSYLYALSQNLPLAEAQTFAFSAWIIGHIVLAFVSRSQKEPLRNLGVFSNKAINIWAFGAFAFLLLATQYPPFTSQLKLYPVSLLQLGLIFVISFLAIFWMELVKIKTYKE